VSSKTGSSPKAFCVTRRDREADAGGKVIAKLWSPLVTPDYTPYLAQIGEVDAVVEGFAGAQPQHVRDLNDAPGQSVDWRSSWCSRSRRIGHKRSSNRPSGCCAGKHGN
jgi:hypothetical protein